jgi:hypothetical protein
MDHAFLYAMFLGFLAGFAACRFVMEQQQREQARDQKVEELARALKDQGRRSDCYEVELKTFAGKLDSCAQMIAQQQRAKPQ